MARISALLIALFLARVASAEPRVISLDEAVNQSLRHNPRVRVALEEIRRARALLEQTRAASMPTATANVGYLRIDGGPLAQADNTTGINLGSANLQLGVALIAPSAWARLSHARRNVDLTQLSAAEVKRELAATVARTYLSIVAQRHLLDSVQRARSTAEAHYQFVHQRFASGHAHEWSCYNQEAYRTATSDTAFM